MATPDGVEVLDLTTEEETVLEQVRTEYEANEKPKIDEQLNVKVSANQKLLDLGFTQAEATALTGYTPED